MKQKDKGLRLVPKAFANLGSTGIVARYTQPAGTGRASTLSSVAERDRQSSIDKSIFEEWTLDMCIAQHSVAGEGNTRPLPATTAGNLPEVRTTDVSTLPWETHHAQHRALYSVAIPTRARLLLAELARTVDNENPLSNIFMRRDNMSDRSHMNIRTLSRALNDLETAGLIVRHKQRRYTYGDYAGCFAGLLLNLTEKAARLLGLIRDASHPTSPQAEPLAEKTTATAHTSDRQPTFAEPSDKVSHGLYKDLSPNAFQKRQPGQLPEDLQRLRSLGFLDFLIFKLMREAREANKLLSDIVEATWEHLKTAHRPICYLRSLIQKPVDFGHQVRSRRSAQATQHRAAQEQHNTLTTVGRHAGKTFYTPNADRRVVVSADANEITVLKASEHAYRSSRHAWQTDFVRAVEEGQLVPETGALATRFEQLRSSSSTPDTTRPSIAAAGHGERNLSASAAQMEIMRKAVRLSTNGQRVIRSGGW